MVDTSQFQARRSVFFQEPSAPTALPADLALVPCQRNRKKTDVAEHPEVFDHVGLLVNEPSSYAGMLFI